MILGVVRKIDNKGRIQIPAYLLEQLDINPASLNNFNIYLKDGKLIISPLSIKTAEE